MGTCNSIPSHVDDTCNPAAFSRKLASSSLSKSNTTIFSSFFPIDLIRKLNEILEKAEWKYGWRSNGMMGYAHWNFNLAPNAKFSGRANGIDIGSTLSGPVRDAWGYIQTLVPGKLLGI